MKEVIVVIGAGQTVDVSSRADERTILTGHSPAPP